MDKKLLFSFMFIFLIIKNVNMLSSCVDDEGKCLNGGICDAFTIGQSLFTKCSCLDSFVGQRCEFRKCSENLCQNDGICEYFGKTFVCHCPAGFSGDFCQEKLPSACDLTECGEHGRCVLLTESRSIAFCECDKGFAGPYCDFIDRCVDQTCSERGKCVNTRFHGFHCQCDIGFDGETCEINKDDCEYNICYPGSTCIDQINGYDCECQNDRVGQFCEHENPCLNNTNCIHGKCFSTIDGQPSCFCNDGFMGQNCDQDVNECEFYPCGDYAECINHHGSYECKCESEFTGKNCNLEKTSETKTGNETVLIFVIVFCFCCPIFVVFILQCRSKTIYHITPEHVLPIIEKY